MNALLSRPRLRHFGVLTGLLAAAADVLFFGTLDQAQGLSVPLFLALVAAGAIAAQHRRPGRHVAIPLMLLALALAALIETVDPRSLILALTALAAFALSVGGRLPLSATGLSTLQRFLALLPAAALRDWTRVIARRRHAVAAPVSGRAWLVWLMPAALGLGFVLLLGVGNPIIERWIQEINPLLLLDLLDPLRILFWAVAAAFVWPFLRPRPGIPAKRLSQSAAGTLALPAGWSPLVTGPAAILRGLALFNAVFAVQTLLDAAYLWGGLTLPDGIGYAAYAHRGAWTLMAAALLAGGFVLLALRPGSDAGADRRIRVLVYLWMAQTVVLVLSAMLRLDLYVDVYALTHWRLAAFVWMGVVATGLVLICLRIAQARSNQWLVGANLAVLALVFAASCFVDDDALIARFNVDHSRELSGVGVALDVDHLASLGPAALPAIDRFLDRAAAETGRAWIDETSDELRMLRAPRAQCIWNRSQDWRRWTFRNWRLSRYLEAHPAPPPPPAAGPMLPTGDGPN